MERIRYRRTSLKTQLGITAEEKRIKRELGITALLRPFRWWGNEKRDVKRELGYYSPDVTLARHVLPHSGRKLLTIALVVFGVPFAIGWWLKSTVSTPEPSTTQSAPDRLPLAPQSPSTAERSGGNYR
jgi:hypothetical protein